MRPVRFSAALLAFHHVPDEPLAVFLGHMGGPLWARRDDGGWSIPKGEYDPDSEDPATAARREFAEEIGVPAPAGAQIDLGVHVQPGGKRVRTFAVPAPLSLRFVMSNHFQMEWPRRSGILRSFPEIDQARWFALRDARRKVVGGQVAILDALELVLAEGGRPPAI
ncbi:MAG: NUDIX domain-containing protein [Candidatus Nanopelagicales bacterium]